MWITPSWRTHQDLKVFSSKGRVILGLGDFASYVYIHIPYSIYGLENRGKKGRRRGIFDAEVYGPGAAALIG